jgi:hypothetical protein
LTNSRNTKGIDMTNEELEAYTREIGTELKDMLLPGVGFILLLFEWEDEKDWLSYISTAKRGDTINALRETANKLEEHERN